ncbi:MAG: methylmalonyl Co-A mutase-associated GTPase MeaB [Candidatus Thorarchaeota archaeon]|nr:MAG: methylmalonyl Co-A mutase-associated GTPase MeaB [Candidatus Thorarchaeota archaeon]
MVEGVLSGNRRDLARLISLIEDEEPSVPEALGQLYRHTGRGHIVGITGPPGSGKSTLVTRMTTEYRTRNKTVGIVCVDPSSPFTGGALLGDRIRMQEHALDREVFVRSMGTRGHLGGLARATSDAVRAIDAFGKDIIIVETVGAGQSEVEVIDIAHTILVIDVPGAGDDIQAIKAGIMEIADIFVVNKSDMPGAERKVTEINAMLDTDPRERAWRPPVLMTNARDGEGIAGLVDTIDAHRKYLVDSGLLAEKGLQRSREELKTIMEHKLTTELMEKLKGLPEYERAIKKIADRSDDPYSVAERLITKFLADYGRRVAESERKR